MAVVVLGCVSAFADLYRPMGEAIAPIVLQGRPTGAIVIAAAASERERAAATELQTYLRRMSGAELSLVGEGEAVTGLPVYVGHTHAAADKGLVARVEELGDEALLMHADADGLFLLGGGELGTRYAVYAFLEEKLGVRWLNPDPLGEIVPQRPTVTIGALDEVQRPAFAMRWIGRGDWALRNRQNVNLPDHQLGMAVYAAAHTFRRFVPPDRYFEQHPEWFAMVGGRRQKYDDYHRNQLCTSNPEVLQAVVQTMRAALDADPDLDVITLFPNDGLGFCECPNCRVLDEATQYTVQEVNNNFERLEPEWQRTLSRRLTIFYRDVAAELLRSHPERTVMCGIYSAYLLPPLDHSLRMPPNALGQLCHGWCHNHAITDPSCPANVAFRAALEGWREIYPNLCMYEYYFKVAALELPFPIIHAMRQDIPWLRDFGLLGIYTQFKAGNVWTIGLNYYVAAKLLWNPDLDVAALVADYCQNLYGPAAQPMTEYWEAYEEAAISSGVHLSAEYADLRRVFTPELIAAQHRRLERARELADDAAVRERVRRAEVVLGYVEVCMDYVDALLAQVRAEGQGRWVQRGGPAPGLQARAEAVLDYLRQHADDNCFGAQPSNYVQRFATPNYALAQIRETLATPVGELTKPQWLQQTGARPPTGPTPATFDLWLYANDLDADATKSEHRLWLRDAEGQWQQVADVPPPGGQADRTDKVCIIRGLPTQRFLVDGKVALRFENLPGEWSMSTVMAWYVMPPLPGMDEGRATALVQSHLEWVRGAAAGFHEYDYRGMPAGESVPVEVSIEVPGGFSRPTLPD